MSSIFQNIGTALGKIFNKATTVESVVVNDLEQSATLVSDFLANGYVKVGDITEAGFQAAIVVVKLSTPLATQLGLE